ncbi:2'-5' RNA ligase family protein [Agrococcus sp. Marseille-Q4369]|uniref:2'-5' RNA ligase family protein n=1 Tax=Agrococcus sp. Marseille-Q4369 TaxID=2810513 RepID=UPI001B8CD42C|nr:2'-5' RNA ligase family protein [Agrococcus sp. Marseille-Q4369]QUW18144.1 2'-5' RNA ligase family protein [Agrococcus sp. Marseille-Q4369]
MEPREPGDGTKAITSLELLLDEAAEEAVRREWDALAAAGFSSLAGHTAASNRPHVTLAMRSSPVPHPLSIDAGLPIPIELGPPLLFGSGERRVLARAVVPSAALLALHAAVLRAAGEGDDPPHLLPGRWLPHVTLARRLRVVDLAAALALLGPAIEARGVAVRRWDASTRVVTHVAP